MICISSQNIRLNFQWSPAHCKIFENDSAHGLVQQATREGQQIEPRLREFPLAKPLVLRHIVQLDKKEILALTLGANTKVGAFTQTIDKASPRHHTPSLYNGKSKAQASILCQLRTGIARLNGYLSKINAVESEMCSCKTGVETVHHFLFYCPLWVRFRSSIRDIGYKHNRWGDTSFFVGGWSGPSKDGEEQAWKPNKEAVWTTINYAISTGRLDNRQDGAEEEGTQRSDESGGGAESDANEVNFDHVGLNKSQSDQTLPYIKHSRTQKRKNREIPNSYHLT